MRRRPLAAGLVILLAAGVLTVAGCAARPTPPVTISPVLRCQHARAEGGQPGEDGFLEVGVMFHRMRALGIDDETRDQLQGKEPAWKLAPSADSVALTWSSVAIDAVLAKANAIWRQAPIRFALRQIDDCTYKPRLLRLDGRRRESMFTPESHVPWASQLFRSINRVFTTADPRVIHVLIWWSIREDDVGTAVQGYGRSAAYGGPAVWTDALQCLTTPDEPTVDEERNYKGCGRLLAHEIGHALGLQHVDDESNLMHRWYAAETITQEQAEQARREARQQFASR